MKILYDISRFLVIAISFLGLGTEMNAQFLKKLGKAAERAAERTVERRVEQETSEKTDQALDSIFESGNKKNNKKQKPIADEEPTNNEPELASRDDNATEERNSENQETTELKSSSDPQSMSAYRKFDFVPGDAPIFMDDFSKEFVGDFPSKWNSNGSGELVTFDEHPEKWLKILPGYNTAYIPDVTNLPEEFTIEFDVVSTGLDKKTSSQAYLGVMIGDNNTFDTPTNWGMVQYSFCQYIARGIIVENHMGGKRIIRNEIGADIRNTILEKHHVSIAVNKQRFRFWINENKFVDIPRLLSEDTQMQGIKFMLNGIDTEKESVYISGIKIAKGGVDLRRKLLAEGKISTNGILFDSGSATIQPQSMGIIRQIYQVMQQESSLRLQIVGHTDADGNDDANMKLSKQRAEAVKRALINVYKVSPDKLSTDGKGASEPIGDNQAVEGKSQNRRVEFIKL